MSTSDISQIQNKSSIAAVDISPKNIEFSSLDERFRDAFSATSVTTQVEYANIMAKVNDAHYLSTPGGLFELQVRLGEYKQQVEVISALTRKGVATVETLLRA